MNAQQLTRYIGSIAIGMITGWFVTDFYKEAGNHFTMKVESLILIGVVGLVVWQYICDRLDARSNGRGQRES